MMTQESFAVAVSAAEHLKSDEDGVDGKGHDEHETMC